MSQLLNQTISRFADRYVRLTMAFSLTILIGLTACNSDNGSIEKEKIQQETASLNNEDSLLENQSRQLFNRLDSMYNQDSSQAIILRLFHDKSQAVFQRTKKSIAKINAVIMKYDSIPTFDPDSAHKDAVTIVDNFRQHLSEICTFSRDNAQKTLDSLIQLTEPTYQILINTKYNQTKEELIYNLSKLKVASRQTQKIMIELILSDWDAKPAFMIIEKDTNGHSDTIHWRKEDYK